MNELRVLAPTAILGYGFPLESFEEALKLKPDVIAIDGGSTDPGPYYLGKGKSFTNLAPVRRDLYHCIKAAIKLNIPLIVGTAGGSGGEPHLQWTLEIVEDILNELGEKVKVASINAQIDKEVIKEKLNDGRIQSLDHNHPLTLSDIEASERIVAQMGMEPFIQALKDDPQVIMAGRAYDPAVFASYCVYKGYDPGLALHMGKILECACIAATPGSGRDCMMGYLGEDYFMVEPMSKIRKCTTLSVAAHTLYEKSNPYILPGPGGVLDLSDTTFEQETETKVKVMGTKFIPDSNYRIKLEGAKKTGYRTISIAGVRDPIMMAQIDQILDEVKEIVHTEFDKTLNYKIDFKIYGKDGVMGALEPNKQITSHEFGLVIDVVAPTQELANDICSFTRSTLLHYGYDNRIATAGNLAFPYSPSDMKAGEVYEFSVYHLLEVDSPLEYFPLEVRWLGGNA